MLPSSKQDFLYYFYLITRIGLSLAIILGIYSLYIYFIFKVTIINKPFLHYLFYLFLHNRYDILTYQLTACSIVLLIILILFWYIKNPHSKTLKFSRFATRSDIRKMKPSILRKDGFCLGSFKNKMLHTNEPLGMLCVAPAGSGKTAGTVIPTILTCDKDSLIVNDPKGELYDLTHKYREHISKVYRIEWGQSKETQNNKTVFWNPLDLTNLPKGTAERAKYIDIITNILIKEVKGDTFWMNSARKTLSAIALFLIYKNELDKKSTSISDVKDILATIGVMDEEDFDGKDASQVGFRLKAEETINLDIPDVIKQRCYNVFSELASTSPNTLGSILATISSDLAIFNNENVREITSKNSFSINEIRGQKGCPVTVYLISPAAEQDLFGVLSGIFVELAYKFITSQNLTKIKKSNTLRFILDEVAFFPKISAVIDGPAIARGYKGSFLFVCQDFAQISDKHGSNALNTMFTNTAFKIVLPQNNDETAERFAKIPGKQRKIIWAGAGKSRKKDYNITNLIEPSDIMSLPEGKQIVFVQNKAKTPIFCDIPFYFKNENLKKKLTIN